ncbi:hypothetical protein R9X47_12505 [Wukongibacter baidiensis]|uniref:hypothetical protein n=1 Tax=Wukongibacter baidiensis TaxID=1723361 RepID=UPI003D7FA45B
MNGYLLLDDGSLFHGKVISETKNILGNVMLDDQGSIYLTCHSSGNQGLVINDSDQAQGDVVLSDVDFQSLKSRIENNNKIQGKIVTDSLPIEYHVYDLKTFIPLGL